MADRRGYYGFGGPPPPMPTPLPHTYPGGPIVVYYPVHPSHYYPPPPPHYREPIKDSSSSSSSSSSDEEEIPQLPGEVVNLPWSTYRWIPGSLSQRSLPPGALRVGTDSDGTEIYAARCYHEGDVLPAKFIPEKNACYIAYGGEEILKDQFEVLVPAVFSWQFSSGGQVPPGAVEAGKTADGETLYFGRVTHDGCITPGKIHPSHGNCYYPFGGEERCSPEYEVLVLA